MPPTKITFGGSLIEDVGQCRVWTRDRWRDEWALVEHIAAEEVTWCCAPSLPVATLRWDYGRILRAGSGEFATVKKLDWKFPKYVKIEAQCVFTPGQDPGDDGTWSTRTWYGVAQLATDATDGAVIDDSGDEPTTVATGTQTILAYGLEILLDRERINFTAFQDADGEQTCDGLRPTFNDRGVKNRSPLESPTGDAYTFYYRAEIGEYWSTKEIVRYLLKYATPREADETRAITFRVRDDVYLPDWDKPEIDTEEATTLNLLRRLLNRERLLCWWLEVVTEDDEDIVELVTQTILKADLPTSLPGNHTIPKATRQLHLIYDQDVETAAVAKDSGLPVCDQVLARGRLVEHVGTFAHWSRTDAANVKQFVQGWTSSESTRYDEGGTTATDYAGLDLIDQQRRNAVARSRPQLENVYSRWDLSPDWQRKASGENATLAGPGLFPRYDAGALDPVPWLSIELVPHVPLYSGHDYAGDAIADLASEEAEEPQDNREYLPPFVLLARPDSPGEYLLATDVGRIADTEPAQDGDEPACTIGVSIRPHSRSLRLRVGGKPQHVIGAGEFVATAEDEIEGYYDFRDMLATLTLTNGLRIEERYPPDAPQSVDQIRVHEIRLPDHYEAVYVAPSTVVGIKTNGQPERSQGGWIERPAGMRGEIKAICKMAHAWYSEPHYVLTLDTTRLLGEEAVKLGDLVVRVGDDSDPDNPHQRDIFSPITEIRISWPTATDANPQAPRMTLTTSAGELDPLQLSPTKREGEPDGR